MKELKLIAVLKTRRMLTSTICCICIKSGKNNLEDKVDLKDLVSRLNTGFTQTVPQRTEDASELGRGCMRIINAHA